MAAIYPNLLLGMDWPNAVRKLLDERRLQYIRWTLLIFPMRYTDPLLPLALIFAVGAVLHSWRHFRKRPWTLAFSILLLLIISSPPLAALFSKFLEARYDRRAFVDGG